MDTHKGQASRSHGEQLPLRMDSLHEELLCKHADVHICPELNLPYTGPVLEMGLSVGLQSSGAPSPWLVFAVKP